MARWIAAAGAFVVSLDSLVNIAFPAMVRRIALGLEAAFVEAFRVAAMGVALGAALAMLPLRRARAGD
jgi:hypothetical protein